MFAIGSCDESALAFGTDCVPFHQQPNTFLPDSYAPLKRLVHARPSVLALYVNVERTNIGQGPFITYYALMFHRQRRALPTLPTEVTFRSVFPV